VRAGAVADVFETAAGEDLAGLSAVGQGDRNDARLDVGETSRISKSDETGELGGGGDCVAARDLFVDTFSGVGEVDTSDTGRPENIACVV
jgi:hypothetical protein